MLTNLGNGLRDRFARTGRQADLEEAVRVRRLRRLEDQFASADGKQRKSFRMVLRRLDHKPGLDGATCRRTLLPNGTLSESVVLGTSHPDRDLTDEELDRWVESFPIELADGRIRWRPLPPP